MRIWELWLAGHSSSCLRVGFVNFPRCQREGRQLPAKRSQNPPAFIHTGYESLGLLSTITSTSCGVVELMESLSQHQPSTFYCSAALYCSGLLGFLG